MNEFFNQNQWSFTHLVIDKRIEYLFSLILIEKVLEFDYTENEVLQWDENTLKSHLTTTFYFYLILALDFDSFTPSGGSIFFRQVTQIVNRVQYQSNWTGWSVNDNVSRSSMIYEFLSEPLKKYHNSWYLYHRKGLDKMIANYSDRGRTTILTILSYLKDLQCIRSSEFLLQIFADAKLSEIVSIATKANQEERKNCTNYFKVFIRLCQTDLNF